MSEMIAFCGLYCTKCPAFIATQANDDIARAKTADMYARKFGFNMKPEDINCDGCLNKNGKLISYCQSCDIRKCAMSKGFDNCTTCDDQPCEKLTKFHSFSPEAKNSFKAMLKKKDV